LGCGKEGYYLDDEVEATTVVVVADGGVTTGDEFTVDLCGDRDVLANREAENVLNVWKLETVAVKIYEQGWKRKEKYGTHMAVLGETLIFFSRGNSFHTLGSRGLVRPGVWVVR